MLKIILLAYLAQLPAALPRHRTEDHLLPVLRLRSGLTARFDRA